MSTSSTLPAPGPAPARGEATLRAAAAGVAPAGRLWATWLGVWNGDLAAAAEPRGVERRPRSPSVATAG